MISFLLPSRGRPDELLVALDSLDLKKGDKEVLIWLDTDDPKLERYKKMLKDNPHVRTFIKERVGYNKGHLMLNFLADQAKYDWYFFFNDDAYMDNHKWPDIFKDFVEQFDPTTEPIALNIWGQGNKANLFPIVSRKFVDICGHFSMGTANDDWIRLVSMGAGVDHHLYGIKPKHRKYGQDEIKGNLEDETYRDAEAARAKYGHEWNPRRGPLRPLVDADVKKIIEYNQSVKPKFSVLVPSRGRANHLKFSLDSLGLEENKLEALVWVDDDDPQLAEYKKLFTDNNRVRMFIKPRVGYKKFHIMLNFLASKAASDWLFLWNDDAYMESTDWYKSFADHSRLVDPREELVVFNIWTPLINREQFPVVSRKYYELLGHISQNALCDLYVSKVAIPTRIIRPIFDIPLYHRKHNQDPKLGNLEDDTKRDIDALYKKSRYLGALTDYTRRARLADIEKILGYTTKRHAGFIGLGKLGLPVALAMENRGNRIIGYDVDPKIKEYLQKNEVPYKEANLENMLKGNLLEIANSIEEVVEKTDLIFCAVQTPHDPKYEGDKPLPDDRADFDYSYLKKAVSEVAAAAKKLGKKVNLVVISTCLPGTYKREIKPLLTPDINYIYNPYFIAMGTVVDDFYNPEFVLIGKDDGDIAPLLNLYKLTLGEHKTFVTDITTAEGIKVFYNTFITTKTVLGNMYGELAHKLGMNADHIYEALALGSDRIISAKYLKSGMGDGGGCHPRDNIALSHLADKVGLSFNYFDSLMKAREKHTEWLARLFIDKINEIKLPGIILGKSFKPETDIATGSPASLLAHLVKQKNITFAHYEFDFPQKLTPGVYFIATQHDAYKTLDYPPGSVIIDPFRYIKPRPEVITLGIGKPAA